MYGNIKRLNNPTTHPVNRAAQADAKEAEAVKAAQARLASK